MTRHPSTEAHVLDACVAMLEQQRRLADRAIAQLTPAELAASSGEGMNSILVLMKHMAGNMRSRWTDFLESDGEKPGRHRDREFEEEEGDEIAVLERWQQGWDVLFAALADLSPADLEREVTIRGRPLTVFEATLRQVSHYAYHVGQIVLLARMQAGPRWRSLSIPRRQG